jgi:PEGA domain
MSERPARRPISTPAHGHRKPRVLASMMLGGLVVVASLAHRAARAEPTSNENAARVLYEAGASAYAAGRFEAATQALSQAYALTPRATVLFSLAQAERRLFVLNGDVAVADSAVAHFKSYLEQVPQGGRRADAVEALGELAVLRARTTATEAPAQPPAAVTRLLVSVEPETAQVRVDGLVKTERPLILETSPGLHTIAVDAPGYVGEVKQVSAVPESVVATEIRLAAKPAQVRLSAPAGTNVWLDGARLGTTPLGTLRIPAGKHRFDFSLPGHISESRAVVLARGAELTVSAALPLTTQRKLSHGLLVGGGVAALLGGAAAITALVYEKEARSMADAAQRGNISRDQLLDYNRGLERRDTWRTVAVGSFSAGAGLLLGGGALYFWNPESSSLDGGGLRLSGRWDVGADGARLGL